MTALKEQATACRCAAKEMRKESNRQGYTVEDATFFLNQAILLNQASISLEKFAALKDALKAESE